MSRISFQVLGVAAALAAGSTGALAQQSRAIQVVGAADEQKAQVETLVPIETTETAQAPVTSVAQPETVTAQPELAEAPVANAPVVREGRYVKDGYGRVFFVRDMAHGRYVALVSDPTQERGAAYGHRVSTGYAYGGRAYAGRGPTCHR